jgi:hypothetical protein
MSKVMTVDAMSFWGELRGKCGVAHLRSRPAIATRGAVHRACQVETRATIIALQAGGIADNSYLELQMGRTESS